jgi:flagellar M-ring protein FliF
MDNAVALAPGSAAATVPAAALPVPAAADAVARGLRLGPRQLLLLGTGLAALVAVAIALVMWSSKGDYKVLYANLSDKDGGAIIAQLSQMNVPYRHADGGAAILVPAAQVHDVRLKLASAGLPKGSVIGFELMDNARFGQTQFQERLTFQRGLEGELVRSIGALAAVQSARVHLALPNQNGFLREQQKPSASVLLTLHPSRSLDRNQLAGIVHLVSSSVPELSPKAVSVLDQSGALLTETGDGSANPGLDSRQLLYEQQLESGYARRILDLLEPVVGRDNLRAHVKADVDFSLSELTSEVYKPNQGAQAEASVRSQQNSDSSQPGSLTPSGVPGATSNQPPTPANAPVQGAVAPLQGAGAGAQGGGSARRDSVVNYELDKTVRVVRNPTGTVRRLAAAVVVNYRNSTDPKGKPASTPLSAEELEKLESLVREAIGFSKERGDSVKLINAPFRPVEAPKSESVPLWQNPQLLDLLRAGAVPAALALIAGLVVFGLLRPAVKSAFPPPGAEAEVTPADAAKGTQLQAVVDDANDLPGLAAPDKPGAAAALPAPSSQDWLTEARSLARENPAAVAGIVRGWVNGEDA